MTDRSAPPSPRAKLELLVRHADEAGFEIREVSSAAAYIQSRPQRVPPETFELAEVASRIAGQRNFILKNRETDRFLILSEPERFLWEQMDGRTSLQEMATAYVLTYGEFDFDIIPNLIRKLQRAQLLTMTPTSRLRRVLARNRGRRIVRAVEGSLLVLERVNISSRRVHAFFDRLYRWGGRLIFSWVGVLFLLAMAALALPAAIRLVVHADTVAAGFGEHPVLALLAVKVLLVFTLAAHQMVHALALVHYGRRVREFGFTFLHGFVPTFYVDVTDIFMVPRRARVVTAVTGPTVHLVLASIWFIIGDRAEPGFVQAFAAASGMIQLQAFVIALYPFCFVEMDGYHVLVDTLGVPTLKQDALGYVGRILRGGRPGPLSREKLLWLGYVLLSILSIAGFVAFNAWLILRATS